MKAKTIIILAFTSLIIVSCELINPILNPQTTGCILQKSSWSIPNDPAHESIEFTYNSSEKLTEVVKTSYDLEPDPYVEKWLMTYTNDKLHLIKWSSIFYSDPEESIGEYLFTYNGNLPDTIHYTPGNSSSNATYSVAQYNGDKLIKLLDYRLNPFDPNYSLFNTTDIVWTGDNISKVTSAQINGTPRIYDYEYDDKKAPLNHIGLTLSSYGSFTMLSKNNVIKTTMTMGSIVYIYESTYTYNDTDYPTSQIPLDGATINYEYNCK